MKTDRLEIHQWITTVHSVIEHALKLTILQNVIIFSYLLWKFPLGIHNIKVRMKRLMWHLDPMLHWLLFKVLMAQEGDPVSAVEGQVCLVRWVSCGDRKEQISISENTHSLQSVLSITVHRAKSGENEKELQKDWPNVNMGIGIKCPVKCTHLSSIKGNVTIIS